jgi:hypothetical protein
MVELIMLSRIITFSQAMATKFFKRPEVNDHLTTDLIKSTLLWRRSQEADM